MRYRWWDFWLIVIVTWRETAVTSPLTQHKHKAAAAEDISGMFCCLSQRVEKLFLDESWRHPDERALKKKRRVKEILHQSTDG